MKEIVRIDTSTELNEVSRSLISCLFDTKIEMSNCLISEALIIRKVEKKVIEYILEHPLSIFDIAIEGEEGGIEAGIHVNNFRKEELEPDVKINKYYLKVSPKWDSFTVIQLSASGAITLPAKTFKI